VSLSNRGRKMHPTRMLVVSFGIAVLFGTLVLLLPISTVDGKSTGIVTALFTAVSAVCVTGLTVVDTATHWSGFGHFAIMLMIQAGGLGIISFATILGLLISGRISLSDRLNTLAEAKIIGARTLPVLLRRVILVYFGFEIALALYLSFRYRTEYLYSWFDSLWHGFFHAISAFNNAGFALYSDNLTRFSNDYLYLLPIMAAVIVGGLGIPVLIEIHERIWKLNLLPGGKRKPFSLHTKMTIWTTSILVVIGGVFFAILDWNNNAVFGEMNPFVKILNAFFASTVARTAGFNTFDISQMDPASWLAMDLLMFIGGGSASTAGGIKVTTLAVLFFIIYTEIRGETAVNVGKRRLPRSIQRQALTLVALASSTIIFSTIALTALTDFELDRLLLEVVSATSTVGLSTGITADLPDFAKIWLAVLMFVGRLGPLVIATALALRVTKRHYELPKERPLIG
jgi:trk system potassium uptake protein TrkH